MLRAGYRMFQAFEAFDKPLFEGVDFFAEALFEIFKTLINVGAQIANAAVDVMGLVGDGGHNRAADADEQHGNL